MTYNKYYQFIVLQAILYCSIIVRAEQHIQEALNQHPSPYRPQILSNFPDPCIVHDSLSNATYAFATTNIRTHNPLLGPHINIQVASLQNDTTWRVHQGQDVLPTPYLAPWQTGERVWAPDVKQLPSGKWLLYYADALRSSPAFHCIGAATADHIAGPYTTLSEPLICPHGGAIDAQSFIDDLLGKRYLIYKVDSNSLGNGGSCNNDIPPIRSTPIMVQEVDYNDGVTLIGQATRILDRDILDGPLIEAPTMYRSHEGLYFLFFSSNCFSTPLYDVSYATATNVLGPFRRAARPLLVTGDFGLIGPGGLDVLDGASGYEQAGGRATVAFHGHVARMKGEPLVRGMYTGTVHFIGHLATFHA